MIDPTFHIVDLPPRLEDAGFAYGRACAPLLEPARVSAYLDAMGALTGTARSDLPGLAARWATTLPERYRVQMEAMASGAGVGVGMVEQWLYADIAAPSRSPGSSTPGPGPLTGAAGPMCSGIVSFERGDGGRGGGAGGGGTPWVARNCDWHEPTLSRGTAAVTHRAPGRIPCLAVGLMGDIDADTGLNAAGLWLHMHTLPARDEPRAGVSCISWLFWMREALETCASLAELEAFIGRTDRDRGVLLFAADGRRAEAAIYECGRAAFTRVDPWPVGGRPALLATNHCRHKHPPPRDAEGRPRPARAGARNGTISRYDRLLELLEHAAPERLPDDLVEILGDPRVEMREASPGGRLRTIYSSVADPGRGRVWFASGACPAASAGTWRALRPRW